MCYYLYVHFQGQRVKESENKKTKSNFIKTLFARFFNAAQGGLFSHIILKGIRTDTWPVLYTYFIKMSSDTVK